MDIPVFKLERVIKSKSEMSDFEGPLTLILHLLSRNRIEIRDISVSLILDQYLEHLGTMTELDLDIACEFVTMASHLTYIKTKMLLSGDEEISEIEQLISSLEELQRGDIYQQISKAAQTLLGMYSRGAALIPSPQEYLPQVQHTYVQVSSDLLEAMVSLINKEDLMVKSMNPNEVLYPEKVTYSIPEKISEVLEILKSKNHVNLAMLIYSSDSRTELIATLVAILELCRIGSVLLTGDADNIVITYTASGREQTSPDYLYEEYA